MKVPKKIVNKLDGISPALGRLAERFGYLALGIIGGIVALLLVVVLWLSDVISLPDWKKETLTLEETQTVIQEVRSIGELISGEFYGEVVHSLTESYEFEDWWQIQQTFKQVKDEYGVVYRRYARDRSGSPLPSATRIDRAADAFLGMYKNDWFSAVLLQAHEDEEQVLEAIRTQPWEQFKSTYQSALDEARRSHRTTLNQGQTLIYLGRGIVKAGYNLSDLAPEQIRQQGDTLFLQNLDPQILNADINPWVAEPDGEQQAGIKGFEALRQSDGLSSGQVARVKEGCKLDLKQEALRAGILATARESAELTLLNFFQLLQGPQDSLIGTVIISPSQHYTQLESWLADQTIDQSEAQQILSILSSDSLAAPQKQSLREQLILQTRGGKHHVAWQAYIAQNKL